jgi:transcriptional regulator GlxA family with amidase domain
MVPAQDRRVDRVLTYIKQNLSRHISLAEAAGIACLEPLYFSKRFRAVVGMTFLSWNTSERIEAAKKMLAAGTSSISAIAAAVGYADLTTFERAFKRHASICPREYRNVAKALTTEQRTSNREQETPNGKQETPRHQQTAAGKRGESDLANHQSRDE